MGNSIFYLTSTLVVRGNGAHITPPHLHNELKTNHLTARKTFFSLVVLLLVGFFNPARAQQVSVKTNLLYDATATINAGAEVTVAPHWSIDLSGNLNAWTIRNHKWRHWMLQPEARYWLCDATAGHFFAAHALGGQYNVGNLPLDFKFLGTDFSVLKDRRYQGWYTGLGLGYGYSWILNRHWNIEAEIAVGWIYTRYDVFPCTKCGKKIATDRSHNYVGPTKAAVSLVYVF